MGAGDPIHAVRKAQRARAQASANQVEISLFAGSGHPYVLIARNLL
jgi:hypothetical protein